MRRQVVLPIVSALVSTIVVLAACSQPTATTTKAAPTTTSAPTTAATTKPVATTGKPQPIYGGTITTAGGADPGAWDPTKAQAIRVGHMQMTSNELMGGDWTKGPQGTGQTNWDWGFIMDVSLEAGELAESWELPDDTTVIYHLNKNARYFKNSKAKANGVVNGRAVTADDVVWNMEMQFNYPTAWQTMSYPPTKPEQVTGKLLPGDARRPSSIRALDKYTVEVKVPSSSQGMMFLEIGDNAYTNPPEIWTSGGDMGDWKNIIGSGPWILDDFVSGSSLTYVKNPDYWEIDPLYPGKGYKWPYADRYRSFIIPDLSTRLSALRTGKIDYMLSVSADDAKPLLSSVKALQSYRRIGSPNVLSGRLDKPELPYKDIRVRRALNLAVNQPEILKGYWGGEAELMGYPYPPGKDWARYYTPLDKMPAEIQELFTYNPEKAKQLLKEAGFPNGFKAKVQVQNLQTSVDQVSMLKDYLSKVGVELTIQVLETGPYNNMDAANSHDEMWYGAAKGIWNPAEQLMTKKGMYSNDAIIDDPYYAKVGDIIARDAVKNPDNYFKTMKEAGIYELASAWAIWMPSPYNFNVWWPWIKNYMGISWTGWAGTSDWIKSIWIDEAQKRSMGF